MRASSSLAFLILLLSAGAAFAQELLTNAVVVQMVKSGLSNGIIVAKIQSSPTAFDTSTEALKKLTDDGVPEAVVVAMITEAGKATKADNQKAEERAKVLQAVPEQGKLADILGKKSVYILTEDLKARNIIEKELGRYKAFTVVDKVEDCDFVIKYESWTETVNVTAVVIGNNATARENVQLVGLLTILMPSATNPESARVRQVYSVRKTKYYVWENNPAENGVKQFVKDLTRASALGGK